MATERSARLIRTAPNKNATLLGAQASSTELHLLRTATWLFAERGFHGTSIRDIADAAELAVSGMYYYTKSKEAILESVMHYGLDHLVGLGREASAAGSEPSEQLASLVAAHVVFHARNPRTARVIDQEFKVLKGNARAEVLEKRDTYEELWSDVLRRGAQRGAFLDRGPLARLALLEMCTGVAHWYSPRGAFGIDSLCEQFADIGLAVVGPRHEGAAVTVADLGNWNASAFAAQGPIAIEPRRRPGSR